VTIAMTTESLLEALRGATRAQHDEIESHLRLMEPLGLARYTAIVTGFDAFLGRWEPRIEAALPPHLRSWWRPRRRHAFAADDLRHLGAASTARDHAEAEAALAQLPLQALPQALGSMYVIEGSALGGQVIAPKLQRELGLVPGAGASYFHGFGRDTGGMWRDFRDMLGREVDASETTVQQACAAARGTFQALTQLFRSLPA
jgi:heme oxygenase